MIYALLASNDFDNIQKVYDVLVTLNFDQDEIWLHPINSKRYNESQRHAQELCHGLGIHIENILDANEYADYVIILNKDNTHEIHENKYSWTTITSKVEGKYENTYQR